jgi:hypothetical protein
MRSHAINRREQYEKRSFLGENFFNEIYCYKDNFSEPKSPILGFSSHTILPSLTLLRFWYLCLIGPSVRRGVRIQRPFEA